MLIVFGQRPWWLGEHSVVRVPEVQVLLKLYLQHSEGAVDALMTGLVARTMYIVLWKSIVTGDRL